MEKAIRYPIMCNLGRIAITAAGYQCENLAEAQTSGDEAKLASADIVSMLLIINSPSRVVSIDDPEDVARADRTRLAQGRPPLPNLRPIRLNVSRLRQIDEENGSAQPGQGAGSEHFVRGHFKWRNNNMWWWSPHLRNRNKDGEPAQPRDYLVFDSQAE